MAEDGSLIRKAGCSRSGGIASSVPLISGTTVHGKGKYPMGCKGSDRLKLCKCGRGYCKTLTSKREHSKGRMFYCCPFSSGADDHGCGMFEWVPEVGTHYVSSGSVSTEPVHIHTHTPKLPESSTLYARGFLDGAIRGSKQQTNALKDVLAALNKLDVNKK